jgi:hypothetical protein
VPSQLSSGLTQLLSAIRPILEYRERKSGIGAGLTKAQSSSIGKFQRRALRIIFSEKDYEKLLLKAGMHSLNNVAILCALILLVKCLTHNTNCTIFFLTNFARYGKGIHVRMINCFTITTTEQNVFGTVQLFRQLNSIITLFYNII